MSETPRFESSEEPKFVVGMETGVTYTADGAYIEAAAVGNMHPEEVREVAAEQYGTSPDNVTISKVDGKPYDKPGRNMSRAAFSSSRWNASWDPKADPSQN